MSVNDIDVNAVNKRTMEAKIAGSTPETSDEEIAELATYMRGSLRWKITYRKLRFIMVLESLIWTLMDIVRAWRMRTAARINDNYKQSRVPQSRDEEAAEMLKNGTKTHYTHEQGK